MRWLMAWIIWWFFRIMLSLRYRIRIIGKEKLKGLKGGVLVLPNHPGYVDPLMAYATVWPALKVRPMVFEGNFQSSVFRLIGWAFNALQIPDLARSSSQARSQAEAVIQAVVECLKRGENHIVWPAGHVERDGIERIGAARAAAEIVEQAPDVTIILLRNRGLWGSSFTWGRASKQPALAGSYLRGMLWIFANLLFFMPRRRITITLERFERKDIPDVSRDKFNRWLEAWYNADGGQKPTWRPYHFLNLLFGPRTHVFPPPPMPEEIDVSNVKPETCEAVRVLVSEHARRDVTADEMKPDARLDQFGMDSIDRMELGLDVERRFGFHADTTPTTVGELLALASGQAKRAPPQPPPAAWFKPRFEETLDFASDSIPQAVVKRALASRKEVAVADDLSGVLTYERFLVGVLSLSKRLAKIEQPNVGLLLPASVGCNVCILALHMAGKLPVILNWTTGPGNLAHAARIMNLTHVVTSKAFVDRTHIKVPGVDYVFVEDIRRSIGKLELLRTLLRVRWFPSSVRRQVPALSPDQPAVVLFTSGSEKAPKAVPLTHRNLLSDMAGGVPHIGINRPDVVIGFLPAFHSFGLTVTSLMPLVTGMRVVFHPDPTDAGNLARKIIDYKVTMFVGTPTFANHILERANPGDMLDLRLFVLGAEKVPEHVFRRCKEVAPNAVVLEGYGITECAPVVSANPRKAPRQGSIGTPIPGVEVGVVDLDTTEWLPPGKMGMLWVSGPTVFPGYIAHDGESPFVERDGKRWYATGDLGEIDAEGYIWFRGRLKRFLKAGGEMISLPALEEPFARLYPPTDEGPRVAVEGIEHEGGRRIVLFTTQQLSLRDANAVLVKEGFHGILRLDEVRRVDKIPVLGTGKTDYKQLRSQIEAEIGQPV